MTTEHMQNYFNPDGYYVQFNFDDGTNDIFKYNIKSTELPSIQFGIITLNYGGKVKYMQGNSRDEGSIPLDLIVDEDLYVYTDMLDLNKKYYSSQKTIDSMNIFIMNTQNVPVLRLDFEDIFFSNIGGPQLDSSSEETEIFMTVELNFGNFDYVRL